MSGKPSQLQYVLDSAGILKVFIKIMILLQLGYSKVSFPLIQKMTPFIVIKLNAIIILCMHFRWASCAWTLSIYRYYGNQLSGKCVAVILD